MFACLLSLCAPHLFFSLADLQFVFVNGDTVKGSRKRHYRQSKLSTVS